MKIMFGLPLILLYYLRAQQIAYGTVVGANAVIIKDTTKMAVLGGNPAKEIRKRQCVHSDLVVESLLGGDYYVYKQTRKIPILKHSRKSQ